MDDRTTVRLHMHGIHKSFGATKALNGVDLSVAAGEVHALVGENGAGKSTLMKILSGALTPDKGSMQIEGEPYAPLNPLDARLKGIGMIYQELSLAPHLTVQENIVLGMEPTRAGFMEWKKVNQLARQALHQLGHENIQPEMLVGTLSTGEQQLVEITRAIAIGCRVLVFDEPTSSLASEDVERLFKLIGHLRDQGMAIVYISHFIEEIKQICDRFTVLRDGETVGDGLVGETSKEQIVGMMIGRELNELYPRSHHVQGDAVLEIDHLTGRPKPVEASLRLHRGEVLGIAGLVGAGRTELLRAIFGLDPVKKGKIRIGVYVGPASPARRWAQGVGYLSEDRKNEGLAPSLAITDNVMLSKLEGFGPAGLVFPSRQQAKMQTWIERLRIKCTGPRQDVADLSGGNQQKVALARLLHHDVDVLILDEPTRGIDVGSKALFYQIIDELATGSRGRGKSPKAVLVVSSYLPELFGICDRIAVMCRGRLGEARPVRELDEHQVMLEATGTS